MTKNIGTRDLCLELLRQLNSEVRIENDDIYFTYQNEKQDKVQFEACYSNLIY